MLNAIYWDVDPIIFEVFGRGIRWYGLLFALGLLILGPMVEEKIWKREKFPLYLRRLGYGHRSPLRTRPLL